MTHLRAALLLFASATFLACPPRVPEGMQHARIENGGVELEGAPSASQNTTVHVEAKKDDAADRALADARTQVQGQTDQRKQAEVYMAVRRAYPETTAGQEALYDAGVLYFEAGDYVDARKSFNTLLFENPLFDKAEDAKLKLGESALQVGAYRDAYQTLSSLAERAKGDERVRLLEAAEKAAEGAFMFGEALRIAIQLSDEARTPEEQKAALDHVTDLVEGKVAFIDVAKAAQDLPPQNPAWPILTFKLARIYYHLRDWTRLQETLDRFLQYAPGHPYAQQAQAMKSRIGGGTQARPNVVGVLLPMTGKYQPYGEAALRGIKLALEGSDVELVVKDTQGDVNLAGKAVEDLVFDNQAIAVIGPLLGDDSKRAALVAEELQIPLLTLTRAENITDIGPHVFRNMLTNSAQAQAVADYGVKVMGIKNWALLYPEVPFGEELANEFWDDLLKQGGEVRAAESYAYDQTTFTTEAKKLVGRMYLEDRQDWLDKLKELKQAAGSDTYRNRKAYEKAKKELPPVIDFDAIYLPDEWKKVGLVAPALAVEDIITNACDPKDLARLKKTTGNDDLKTVTLFGSSAWTSPKGRSGLPELVERGGKFVICSIWVDGFYADSQRPATRRFVTKFQNAYKDIGRDPILLEAYAYDAGAMFRSVIDKKKPADREAFRASLADVRGFEGATGTTSFNDKREGEKQLFFLTVDSKGVKELSPTAPKPGT